MVQLSKTTDDVIYGSSITLSCTIVSQIPAATNVYWQVTNNGQTTQIVVASSGGKYSGSTLTNPSLTIYNAVFSDGGLYRCFAQNLVGTGQSSELTLTIAGGRSKRCCGVAY